MSLRNVLTLAIVTIFIPAPAGAEDIAADLQEKFIEVAEQVSDSVVYIEVKSTYLGEGGQFWGSSPFDLEEDPGGFAPIVEFAGSGVILDPDGHILTNAHVVREAVSITAHLHDGRSHEAELVGADPDSDLAVIRIDAPDLQAAAFAEEVRIGQWAIALGSPFGLQYSMTVGHVSAQSRHDIGALPVQNFIQTDASINPGNSGGPLVDIEGRVIGINTMIVGMGTGIGLAIPNEIALQVSHSLIETGRVVRGDAGVAFHDAAPGLLAKLGAGEDAQGVVVAAVEPDGPAAAAGIQRGDVIVRFDGHEIATAHDLTHLVFARAPGAKAKVEWLRGGKAGSGMVTLAERPVDETAPREDIEHTGDDFGFNVDGMTPEVNQRLGREDDAPGLIVTRVRTGSPAQRAGFMAGDIILEVEGAEVRYPIDLAKASMKIKEPKVLIYVYRPYAVTMDGGSRIDAYRYLVVDKP